MKILRTLINFGAGLAGGRAQLALWAAVAIAGGLYIANHQRVVKEKAMLEQRNEDLDRDKQKVDKDYADALQALQVEREKLAALKDTQAKERAALGAVRGQITEALSEGFGDIAAKGSTIDTEIRPLTGPAVNALARSAIAGATAAGIELDRLRASH